MLVNYFRRGFANFPFLYSRFAGIYHSLRYAFTRVACKLKGVHYFPAMPGSGAYKSQFGQDKALESLCLLRKGGVFVEVGCNHPINNSNSFYLESQWGYSGIAIDPIDYGGLFRQVRPHTQFINCAIDAEKRSIILNMVLNKSGWEDQVSSVYDNVLSHGRGFQATKQDIQALTLAEACKDLSHVDILLLDVEGHEINVLSSLDWLRISPDVVIAENTGEFYPRSRLEKYMVGKGYRLIARVGASDDIYRIID